MAETHSSPGTTKRRRTLLPSPGVLLVLTLLIIGGVVAVLIGFRYDRQQRIITHVEAHGGIATSSLEPEWLYGFAVNALGEERARGFGEIVAVDFNSFQYSPYGWGGPGLSTTISSISIPSMPTVGGPMPTGSVVATGEFTGDTLRELRNLRSLRSLNLYYLNLGNDGLRHVGRFTSLEHLSLCGTQVGNDGLRHLRTLANLESLDLSATQVNGVGLAHLSRHRNLKTLNLDSLRVSDADVPLLSSMTSLEHLTLTNTYVSSEAVEELRRQLPHCQIDN